MAKSDWGMGDTVLPADMNQIGTEINAANQGLSAHKAASTLDHPDGSVTDAKIGNRTIDDTVTAAAGADTPTRLWSKLANMIKAITGKANWWTPPATSIEALKNGKLDASAVDVAETSNTVAKRDTTGGINAFGFTSTRNDGNPPFLVSSQGKVNNLNVDLLDGYHADDLPNGDTIVKRTADGSIRATHNVSVTNNGGEARGHVFNGAPVAEWKFGQKSGADHDFKFTKVVASDETDFLGIRTDGMIEFMYADALFDRTASPYTNGIRFDGDGTGWRFPIRRRDGTVMAYIRDFDGELFLTPSQYQAWHNGNPGATVAGEYTGNGSSRTISLGFLPKIVWVQAVPNPVSGYFAGFTNHTNCGVVFGGSSSIINGFTTTGQGGFNLPGNTLNVSGQNYRYTAWR